MELIDPAGRWAEPDATGATYVEHLATKDLSVGTYSLRAGAADTQSPHSEDEIYVVTAGRAQFTSGDETVSASLRQCLCIHGWLLWKGHQDIRVRVDFISCQATSAVRGRLAEPWKVLAVPAARVVPCAAMNEVPHLRVSDHEREQAAAAIREHYAAGRLDAVEFEERLQAVYGARTRGELDALSADLPALPLTAAQARAAIAERRVALRRRAIQKAGGSLSPFVVCTVIWATTGAGFFWPVFLLLGPAAVLARVGWALYGPDPDLEAAEAEILGHGQRGHRHRPARRQRLR